MLLVFLIYCFFWALGGLPDGSLRDHGLCWQGVAAVILGMLLGLCLLGKL